LFFFKTFFSTLLSTRSSLSVRVRTSFIDAITCCEHCYGMKSWLEVQDGTAFPWPRWKHTDTSFTHSFWNEGWPVNLELPLGYEKNSVLESSNLRVNSVTHQKLTRHHRQSK